MRHLHGICLWKSLVCRIRVIVTISEADSILFIQVRLIDVSPPSNINQSTFRQRELVFVGETIKDRQTFDVIDEICEAASPPAKK